MMHIRGVSADWDNDSNNPAIYGTFTCNYPDRDMVITGCFLAAVNGDTFALADSKFKLLRSESLAPLQSSIPVRFDVVCEGKYFEYELVLDRKKTGVGSAGNPYEIYAEDQLCAVRINWTSIIN